MEKTTSIYSPHVLIVEGIFALYDSRVLELLDMKVGTIELVIRDMLKADWPRAGLLRSRRRYMSIATDIARCGVPGQKCRGCNQAVVHVGETKF